MSKERDAWITDALGVSIDSLRKAADAKKSSDAVSGDGGLTTATASQVVRNVKEVKGLRNLDTRSGRAMPLYDRASAPGEDEIPENPAQPLDDHKQKAWFEKDTTPPPPDPDPKIVSKSDETFPVPADTCDTFLQRSVEHLGGKEAGHTRIIFDTSPTFKAGHCDRAGITVTTQITRPVWGDGRPSEDHKKAIQKAVKLIQEHEGRHRQDAIDVATRVVKEAVGKTQAAAEAILGQIDTKNNKAVAKLDAKEGKISCNGTDVKLGPVT